MKRILCMFVIVSSQQVVAQDLDKDYSRINSYCKASEYLLNLFTIHGGVQNQNEDDTVSILINHGYCLGFSKKHNQPLWAAYQVSAIKEGTDYERFPSFVDDTRLPTENQVGAQGFGGGYDRGHLTPNSAINKQFGKLAQMETFLMSNISPQKAGLNQGVWQKLEAAILNDYCYHDDPDDEHTNLWVIVGPIFSDDLQYIERRQGTNVSIPEAFYCIILRPTAYPFDQAGKVETLSFIFSQELPKNQKLDGSFFVSINEIEEKTKLNFFPDFTKHYERKIEQSVPVDLW